MKLKPIVWREYDEMVHGFVGGLRLFSYQYNTYSNNAMERYKLNSRLPVPPRLFSTREACQEAAQSMLQKFASAILE